MTPVAPVAPVAREAHAARGSEDMARREHHGRRMAEGLHEVESAPQARQGSAHGWPWAQWAARREVDNHRNGSAVAGRGVRGVREAHAVRAVRQFGKPGSGLARQTKTVWALHCAVERAREEAANVHASRARPLVVILEEAERWRAAEVSDRASDR